MLKADIQTSNPTERYQMTTRHSSTSIGRYASYQFLSVQVSRGIAVVTFNRPETLNAVRSTDHAEMVQILRDLAQDDDVRVAVVTGAGRAFSVGGDLDLLDEMIDHPERLAGLMDEGRAMINGHIALHKPIVAAVNGYAAGAGLAFALLCDWIVADRGAKLADGHTRAGLAAGDGGALIWPLTVGLAKAKRYLLTGDWITAEEAERIGLITEVVEPGRCLERALAVAERLAAGPQLAISYTKQALNQWLRMGAITAFDYSLGLEIATFGTDEMRAATKSLRDTKIGGIPPEA
jgi:enoyl-CoA hydratase